jgi:ribosomal protein S18 acetylase RimI-like enzyme
MEIVAYEPSLTADLTAAYNRGVQSVPHCYPVAEEWIARVLAPTIGAGEPHPLLHSEVAFVAREGRAVVGFVHTAVGPGAEGEPERGSIRFLWYERGHRAAGQALLQAAESDLRGKGMRQVEAVRNGDKYFFYHVNPAHLSDHLEHVQALLKINGYRPIGGEVVLDWPHYTPGEPTAPGVEAEIALEWSKGQATLPLLAVRARRGGEEIGVCESLSLGEISDAEAAQDWLFVIWLWVKVELRGKGLGRHLLQRNLHEMHGAGYRHASISTDWENHRAFLFYSNHGFHQVDWTFCYGRELTER